MNDLKIIDAHGHLGDILYPNGGELIFETGIEFPGSFLSWFLAERVLYRETVPFKIAEKISPYWSTKRERKRNQAATLENLRKSLDGTNIVKCVCAPVAPNVTYEDIRAAAKIEPRIVAFASPDFTVDIDVMREKLESDLKNGAKGVKIHPVIQETEADSDLVKTAVEILQPYSVPVLLHAGPARYYLPPENKTRFIDFASIEKIERLIKSFPGVNFIVGHAGLDDFKKVIGTLPKYKNAYIDVSFQYPQAIKDLIEAFGGERVMFASDWHYGLRQPAILAVLKALEFFKNDEKAALKKLVFYENAAGLLRIT